MEPWQEWDQRCRDEETEEEHLRDEGWENCDRCGEFRSDVDEYVSARRKDVVICNGCVESWERENALMLENKSPDRANDQGLETKKERQGKYE